MSTDVGAVLFVAGTGLLTGLVHVLTGPDHLSALATVSVGKRWKAFWLGIRWGLGHSCGTLIIAMIFFTLRERFDRATLSYYGAYVVGVFMLILGFWGLYKVMRERQHETIGPTDPTPPVEEKLTLLTPERQSTQATQSALEIEGETEDSKNDMPTTHQHATWLGRFHPETWNSRGAAAFAIGLVHGLAGAGGFLWVLPGVALPLLVLSISYLSCFFFSSTLIMGLFAALYGELTFQGSRISRNFSFILGVVSTMLSVIVGILWIVLNACGVLDEIFEDE
eukprot:GILK01010685.1.p1 GENE.GILK01010685.1~~GILK01010685.1.p1  ORF type:complete len:293 (-),score=19.49 GILK01010685.1:176-1015(-)